MKAFLCGFGAYLPERVVTNQEIAARIGRSAEWIETASGIQQRRWASVETSVADLAVAAGQDCLAKTFPQQNGAETIGLVIVASGSAPAGFPGPAAEVAERLGCGSGAAIDLPMASAGSLFGMAMAARMTEAHGNVLVIGVEKMSAVLRAAATPDPNTEILFGDGAGAVLISAKPMQRSWRILDTALHSDGSFRGHLYFREGILKMDGLSVILQASRKLPAVIQEVLSRQNIAAKDVTAFLMHQANQNLLTRVAKTLGVAESTFYSNISRYGNTSSASMLIAASEWASSTNVNGPVVFAAFGAGFHWGALVACQE